MKDRKIFIKLSDILKEFKIKVSHGKFTVRSRYRGELAGSVQQIEASIKAMEGLIKGKSKKKNKKEYQV